MLVAPLLLAGCGGRPRLKPQSWVLNQPTLGITVSLNTPIPILEMTPSVVYFAKVDGESGLLQPRVVASDYSSGGTYYATNVQPGTYVAVGAQVSPEKKGVGFTIYFSTGIMERTRTTVGGRELAFMGDYWVYMIPGLWGADAGQKHYASVITPMRSTPGMLRSLIGDTYYRGVLMRGRNDGKARDAFLRFAKEDLDRREASVPGVPVAERFFWTGPDGNLGLEIMARFESQAWLERATRPDMVIGSFRDKNPPHAVRDWTLREILVSMNLNAAEIAAVWRVSGPEPLIAAYAEALLGLSKKNPIVQDVSYRSVNFKPAAR